MPEIELKRIRRSKLNPRLDFTNAELNELAKSIKQVGLIEPIIVRPKDDYYEIVVGERRYRAARQAGLKRVPCIVRGYSDDEVMELNLIENTHRGDLSAVEKGRVCTRLLREFASTYPNPHALALRLGVSDKTVLDWLEADRMPASLQRLIAPETSRRLVPPGKIDYRTATTIARHVKEPERAARLIEHVAATRVPRRLAIQVAKAVAREPQTPVPEVFARIVHDTPPVLPFSRAHGDAVLSGLKTQTSRKSKDPNIRPGAAVRGAITHFADLRIGDVSRKRLGDFDEDDARREGGYTLEEFKHVWKRLHGEWDPDETVYVIRFEVLRAV